MLLFSIFLEKVLLNKIDFGPVEASVDCSDDKFETVFNREKTLSESAVDSLAIAFANKLFGRFSKAVEKAFESKKLKSDKLRDALESVLKSLTEFLMQVVEPAVSEKPKEISKLKM